MILIKVVVKVVRKVLTETMSRFFLEFGRTRFFLVFVFVCSRVCVFVHMSVSACVWESIFIYAERARI